ncbi:hypothetical protein U9M48_015625 [Paspalum notatum var. saurae]|uniref:Uncharacterized protein n=1 Tax=Paspalum notatum var. saurae TaxID=547442 RepID=A0AAQ3T4U0_PASNO
MRPDSSVWPIWVVKIVIYTHAFGPPLTTSVRGGLWQGSRMQPPVRLLAASAVGGGAGFSAVILRSVREWRRGKRCRKVISFSSSGSGGEEEAARSETPEEARKRLAELDALLEGLIEPKMRPPVPPPRPLGHSETSIAPPTSPLDKAASSSPPNARRIVKHVPYSSKLLTENKDPYLDRAVMTGRGSTDELPEFSPTYLAFSTLALFILTIFTNVMFNLYIKPSLDGVYPPERIERVPLVNPADRPSE